jgi:hypothetical protein
MCLAAATGGQHLGVCILMCQQVYDVTLEFTAGRHLDRQSILYFISIFSPLLCTMFVFVTKCLVETDWTSFFRVAMRGIAGISKCPLYYGIRLACAGEGSV